MLRKRIMMLLVCAAVWVYPVAADAGRGDGPPPGRWWQMPEMSAALELSQADKDALDALYVQNRRTLIGTKNDLEKEHFELENILEQQSLNEQAAMDQFRKIERLRGDLAMERFRYLLEVRKVLGYERYMKLMTMAREFRDSRRDRRDRPDH